MTYPQPNSDEYAIKGSQFFRLYTPLSSPGDIYQSTQSGHGFAIGPDSDIANVNIGYYDEQVSTRLQSTVISVSRAFVGRIDARLDQKYNPSNRPGKILFSSNDLYDPNFRPRSAIPADRVLFVAPVLDVIEYFKPIESLTPGRQDKEFVFQNYDIAAGTLFIVVPYYGRKYCFTQFTNREVTPNTFGISTVNYCISPDGGSNPYHQETTIRAPAAVAGGATVTTLIKAGTQGMFDALVFSISGEGAAPLRILMSDTPQGS